MTYNVFGGMLSPTLLILSPDVQVRTPWRCRCLSELTSKLLFRPEIVRELSSCVRSINAALNCHALAFNSLKHCSNTVSFLAPSSTNNSLQYTLHNKKCVAHEMAALCIII